MYTLHGYKDGIYSPSVFALLPDKKKPTYIRMLQLLQSSCNERNFTLSPATVHTDLEVTMIISAVHYIWSEAVVALSNFHLCQAWYRKIQAFNLTTDYRDVKFLVGRWLRLVFALPTLSADSVRECFLTTLTDLLPDTTEANLFTDYIWHVPTSRLLLVSDHVEHHNLSAETSKPQMLVRHSTDIFNPASRAITQIFSYSWKLSRWNKIEQVSNNELKGHYQRGKITQVKKNKELQWPRNTNMVNLTSLDTSLKCQK